MLEGKTVRDRKRNDCRCEKQKASGERHNCIWLSSWVLMDSFKKTGHPSAHRLQGTPTSKSSYHPSAEGERRFWPRRFLGSLSN